MHATSNLPGFTLALSILHPCIALAIYLSTCIPLPQQLEASPPPLGNIRHAAGRRSGLSSCGAYRRPPLRSGLSVIPTTIALLYAPALKLAKLIGATVLRCCQGRSRAPHPVRHSPMTAPPPCGTGQTTGRKGRCAPFRLQETMGISGDWNSHAKCPFRRFWR